MSVLEYELVLRLQPQQFQLTILDGATVVVDWTIEEAGDVSGRFGGYMNGLAGGRFGQVTLPGLAPIFTGIEPDGHGNINLERMGGVAPYLIESSPEVKPDAWVDFAPATQNQSQSLAAPEGTRFFRLRSAGPTPE